MDFDKTTWAEDEVEMKLKVKVKEGIGTVAVRDELPDIFRLVDGSNFQILWKGFGEMEEILTYKVRVPKRGLYKLPELGWESEHALFLKATRSGSSGEEREMIVRPRTIRTEEFRGKRHIATSPFPREDVARIGSSTTEFKEIRDYVFGDPVRQINWKATARRAGSSSSPLVNEYEAEGKKAVWVFLDASERLAVGTSVENVFEHSIRSADSIIKYFTELGFKVGMYVFNDGEKLFYPRGGEKQYRRLLREIVELEQHDRREGFEKATEKCKSLILRYKPFTTLVTNVCSQNSEGLIEGVKRIRALTGSVKKRSSPIMIVDVLPHHLNPTPPSKYKENAGILRSVRKAPIYSKLRGMGVTVLGWDPREEKFSKVLLERSAKR